MIQYYSTDRIAGSSTCTSYCNAQHQGIPTAREMLMIMMMTTMTTITAERRALLELWLVGECRSTRERLRDVPSVPFVSTLDMTWWKRPEDNLFFRSVLLILIRNCKANTSEGRLFRYRRRNKGAISIYWRYSTNWMHGIKYTIILCLCICYTMYLCICYTCCFTLDAGLLARSQYPEGPATGHLDTGFSWFPCV
jgi:hypothetical protein